MNTIKILLISVLVYAISACDYKQMDYTGRIVKLMPDSDALHGWTADSASSFYGYDNGSIFLKGRSTLYYNGEVHNAQFKNFEILTRIMTEPGAVAGLWFHSGNASGYQALINNTPASEEHRKTGSLSAVRNLYKSLAVDEKWFTLYIKVVDKHITIKVNDILVVDYVEPVEPYRIAENSGMKIAKGSFAFSNYTEKGIRICEFDIKPLPDDEVPERTDAIDEQNDAIIKLQQVNFPVIDFHVHLKGWNQHQALDYSRKNGIFYGIAPNCGIGFPVTSDDDIYRFLDTTKNLSCFLAMQGEGREWHTTFSREAAACFDYVFTDAMTFTDHKGRRTRIWIPEEVFIDVSHEKYMNMLVDRTIEILRNEPIDIYVNPTCLPAEMMPDYDKLWTDEYINKLVRVLVDKGIALEINSGRKIPSEKIIKAAKDAGVRFAFGTNNADSNIGKLEYSIEMAEKCGITRYDMFFPKK